MKKNIKISEQAKQLIALGNTDKAFSLLSDFFYYKHHIIPSELSNEFTLLSNRYNNLSLKERGNLLTNENISIEKSKLNYSLIQFTEEISKFEFLKPRFYFNEYLDSYSKEFIGKEINGYELIEFVGVGGFGIVFKVKHKHLDKIKAIKLSHPIDDDISIIENLLSSAITPLKKLNHQNIVKIDDVGLLELDNYKRMFILMDLVEGDNYRVYLNKV